MGNRQSGVDGNDDREHEVRDVMRIVIGEQWRALWNAMPSRRQLDDPEAIHEVRVASRRLRAAMAVAADVFSRPWYRRLSREAKRITRTFGAVRDADVMLERLRAECQGASPVDQPGLSDLIARQEAVRREAIDGAGRSLKRLRRQHVRQETRRRFPHSSGPRRGQSLALAGDSLGPFAVAARATIAARSAELRIHGPAVADPQAVTAAHEARIAAKRLRYTVELFGPTLGDDGATIAGELKTFQEALGELHDCDVLIATIHTRLGELIHERQGDVDRVRASLESLLARYQAGRAGLHAAAIAQWSQLSAPGIRLRLDRLGDLSVSAGSASQTGLGAGRGA